MKKIIIFVILCFPVIAQAQTNVSSAERIEALKAEAEAKAKAAQEAAQKAIEAAKAAEEAAKAVAIEAEKAQKEAEKAQKKAEKTEKAAQQKAENERIAIEKAAKKKAEEQEKEQQKILLEQQKEKQAAQKEQVSQPWTKPVIQTLPNDDVENKEEKSAKKEDGGEDEKYLDGAVPLVDGNVEWDMTFHTDRSTEENYQRMLQFLAAMAKEENQLPTSNVSLVNEREHSIAAHYEEWIVFARSLLSLDRTKFIYNIIATCEGKDVKVKLFRISYRYEEDRTDDSLFKAEEWITDDVCLNKKKTKLNRISGKFRRKTIDRKDEIFNNISQILNSH